MGLISTVVRAGAVICGMALFSASSIAHNLSLSGRVDPVMEVSVRHSMNGLLLRNKGNQKVCYREKSDKKIALTQSSVSIGNSTDTWSIVILAP